MSVRHHRLRTSKNLRDLVREHQLQPTDVIQPFFVIEGKAKKETIPAMPGIYRFSLDLLLKDIEAYVRQGGRGGILFGISAHKDNAGAYAMSSKALVPVAIKAIKKNFPDFLLFSDVCLCAYLTHGHCGIIHNGSIDNDASLPVLAQMALAHAQAGVDFVAPSDMMDGRVFAMRQLLEKNKFKNVGILSYAVKYASAFYGPFREASKSRPSFGDRRTYQMDPANTKESVKEALQDIQEGADMIMVKPALAYLDIIKTLKDQIHVPIVAYNVSGEYSMVKAAAQKGWINEKDVVLESLLGMKRAGASIIISYHSKDVIGWLK